jgi:putative restriction endonuclease
MAEERRNWTRDETIVAFNLYCKIPFKEVTKTNSLILKFAPILRRTPSALNMKIGNLASLDPELKKRGISGLVNRSKLDEEIWEEFNGDWDTLAFESEKILARLQGAGIEDLVTIGLVDDDLLLPAGTDKQTVVKARVNQAFFRSAVLAAYENKCCITGLSVPQLLVASHIIPWVKNEMRTDPRNGLLLNSIHDKAFDTGLITITTDYKIKVSHLIHDLLPSNIIKEWFIDYEGQSIKLPEKFFPSTESLKWHNDNVFKG